MNQLATNDNKISDEMKEVIKNMYFPKSSDNEFKAFLFDAEAKGLNPLQREIMPLRISGKVTTVVSRDGYVKKAKQNPNFLGYRSQAIYQNDYFTYSETPEGFNYEFRITNFADRGELIGAFCHVTMKPPVEDTFAVVSYNEVRRGTPVWKTSAAFMTEKVAEVRALKPIANLSGIVSDVEMGRNITADEEVVDIDPETEEVIEVEHNSTTSEEPKEAPKKETPKPKNPHYKTIQEVADAIFEGHPNEHPQKIDMVKWVFELYKKGHISKKLRTESVVSILQKDLPLTPPKKPISRISTAVNKLEDYTSINIHKINDIDPLLGYTLLETMDWLNIEYTVALKLKEEIKDKLVEQTSLEDLV